MSFESPYLFAASMDVEPAKEALFNEVYDTEHVPMLVRVPGVISIARFKAQEFSWILSGQRRTVGVGNEPRYTALYELASPEVLSSEAWAQAVERGRWPGEVRPHTTNRRHMLYRRLAP